MNTPTSSDKFGSRIAKWYNNIRDMKYSEGWCESNGSNTVGVIKPRSPIVPKGFSPSKLAAGSTLGLTNSTSGADRGSSILAPAPSCRKAVDESISRDSSEVVLQISGSGLFDQMGDKENMDFSGDVAMEEVQDSKVMRKLRSYIFQLYCRTSQCSICLGSLGSNTTKDAYVDIPFGQDLKVNVTNKKLKLSWSLSEEEPIDEEVTSSAIGCLPCGHSFCKGCMDEMVEQKAHTLYGSAQNAPEKLRVRCPLCRKKVKRTNICIMNS